MNGIVKKYRLSEETKDEIHKLKLDRAKLLKQYRELSDRSLAKRFNTSKTMIGRC